MTQKVFFSFHHKRDAWRAGQVRNSDLLVDEDEYGFVDAVEWEEIKKQGDDSVRRWINNQMKYTSVTVVLIGAETSKRPWVNYEIEKSWERGNGSLGVRIHNVKDQDQKTDIAGANPFDNFELSDGTRLSSVVKVYDWVTNNGRENLGKWVEAAFTERESYTGETKLKRASVPSATPTISRVSTVTVPRIGGNVLRDPGEQILSDSGITENLQYSLSVDAQVEQSGFRPFSLRGTCFPLKKKRKLTFAARGNFPDACSLKWKVKNFDQEARDAGDMRGEITDDKGFRTKIENTKYTGSHYVECYAILGNVCVATDRLDVPIANAY